MPWRSCTLSDCCFDSHSRTLEVCPFQWTRAMQGSALVRYDAPRSFPSGSANSGLLYNALIQVFIKTHKV